MANWVTAHFIEFQNFGLNAITLSFAATTFFAMYGAWGLVKQIQRVRSEGAGSVSVFWMLTFLATYSVCLPYGIVNAKFALVVTFVFRVPLYMILVPLIYKAREGFNAKEWGWLVIITMVGMCAFLSVNWTFLALAWIGAVMAADQPRKIWSTKSVQGVSIELIVAYLATVTFWIVYGLATSDWFIVSWGTTFFVIYMTTVALYYTYKSKSSSKS